MTALIFMYFCVFFKEEIKHLTPLVSLPLCEETVVYLTEVLNTLTTSRHSLGDKQTATLSSSDKLVPKHGAEKHFYQIPSHGSWEQMKKEIFLVNSLQGMKICSLSESD